MSPNAPTSTPGTLRLSFDFDQLEGDSIAAIVEMVERVTEGRVALRSVASEPASLELVGAVTELERFRQVVLSDALQPVVGGDMPTIQVTPGSLPGPQPGAVRRTLVLVADGELRRAHRTAELLGREDVESIVVTRARAAATLLQHTRLPFDAAVLHDRLPDADALAVLDAVEADRRPCSVLVFDDEPRPERAKAYRRRGAFRYAPVPIEPLQLMGHVHATVLDSQNWRGAGQVRPIRAEAPPRCFLDPEAAADRLAHLCRLSTVERQVALWVLLGLRDLDIAKRLRRSERTAKRHVGCLLEKAGIQNRASLWSVLYHDGRDAVPERSRDAQVVLDAALAANEAPGVTPSAPTVPAAEVAVRAESSTAHGLRSRVASASSAVGPAPA